MFALVEDVESYPHFLPWCSATQVIERTGAVTRARIDIDYHGLASHISTRNLQGAAAQHGPRVRGWPVRRFGADWRSCPSAKRAAAWSSRSTTPFSSARARGVLGPVFGHIIETLVDRFVERARRGRSREHARPVAIALPRRQEVVELELPGGSTRGRMRSRRPIARALPAASNRPGSRRASGRGLRRSMRRLRDGDRVELYRPLSADPKAMRRARARLKPSTRSRSGP